MKAGWLLALVCSLPAAGLEGVELSFEPTSKKDSYTVQVQGTLDVPPSAVRHVVINNCAYREHYAYIQECRIWRQEGTRAWAYSLLNMPVLDPRDYVAVRQVTQDLAVDGSGTLHMDFFQDDALGPPPRNGVVRVLVNEGSYELQPRDNGKRTFITYRLTLSPGGSVPLWMARLAARRASPETLSRLEKAARYAIDHKEVRMPVAGAPWDGVPVHPLPQPRLMQGNAP